MKDSWVDAFRTEHQCRPARKNRLGFLLELRLFSIHKRHPLIWGGHFDFRIPRSGFNFKGTREDRDGAVGKVSWEAVEIEAVLQNEA